MSTQRLIGTVLSLFTTAVVLAHAVRGMLSEYDLFYAVILIGLVASAVVESKALKGFQVLILFLTGLVIVGSGDEGKYIGLVMMTFAYMQAYTYGAFHKHGRIKTVLWVVGFYAILIFVPGTFTSGDLIRGLLWLAMCMAVQFLLWVNARDLIEKARKLDELERVILEQRLIASESILKETVDAGMVLVREIKSKENGCEE